MLGTRCLWQPDGTAQGPRSTVNLTDDFLHAIRTLAGMDRSEGVSLRQETREAGRMSMKEETFPAIAVGYAGMQPPPNGGKSPRDVE